MKYCSLRQLVLSAAFFMKAAAGHCAAGAADGYIAAGYSAADCFAGGDGLPGAAGFSAGDYFAGGDGAAVGYCAGEAVFAEPGKPQDFTLKGDIKGLSHPAMLYLTYKDGGKLVRDSASIADGHFLFKGVVERPVLASLYLKLSSGEKQSSNSRRIYIDPGVMGFASGGVLDSAVITGSLSNRLYDEYNGMIAGDVASFSNLRTRAFYNRANRDSVRLLTEQSQQALQDIEEKLTVFVKKYPSSYVSWDLVDERRVAMNPKTFKPSFEALSPVFQNSPEGKVLAEQIVGASQVYKGVRSPDFSQNDVHENPVSLRSLHGKYVLIDFWASWCGICRAENPNVLRAYNAYKDSGFTVLGVSLDDSKDKWLKAVGEDNMPWQQVCDMKGTKNDVAVLYGIVGIPQNVLLDPNGVIIAKNLRDRDLMNKLMELFDAGRNMRVDGQINGLGDNVMVARYYKKDKLVADTIAVHDGHFTWLTAIPEPEKVQASFLPSGRTMSFFADNGYLVLSGSADSLDNLHLKGSWLDDEARAFYRSIKGITDQQQRDKKAQEYVHEHPGSLLSLYLVNDMDLAGTDPARVYKMYMSLSDEVRGMPTGRRIATQLSAVKQSAMR